MGHRKFRRTASAVVALTFTASLMTAPDSASAGEVVSCETYNPCTTGVCLEDGTCEASPSNEGEPCNTFNPCTQGQCSGGQCAQTPTNNGNPCETYNPCLEKNGTCSEGACTAPEIPDDSPCRADVLGSCIIGTCTTIVGFKVCLQEFKCGNWEDPCTFNCNFATGNCEPVATHVCDNACTTGTCVPGIEFTYTCTDVVHRPNNTPCEDGNTCNGSEDSCQSGQCVGEGTLPPVCGNGSVEAPEECDDGDTERADGEHCDELCTLVPCGKPTNSTGTDPKASDALFTLKVAVNSATCVLALCDVNDSGGVTASDALVILKKAVGTEVTLDCPAV